MASTATTRNTQEQIKALYGNRNVNIFPPSGLSYKDSFFAKIATTSKRRYLGFMPTGKTAIDTQLQLLAHLLYARIEAYLSAKKTGSNKIEAFENIDKYWTLVAYYNSLRDVGRTHNKVGDEIITFTAALQTRMRGFNPKLNFNHYGLSSRVEELTSRIPSTDIKKVLKRLEEQHFSEDSLHQPPDKEYLLLKNIVDLVLATNMISVGIDIERLNVMLMNGQPRNIAEYIQASSRVGRKFPGLVVSLLDANRARDKSHFEHFLPFHQAFYKSVEPLSITPFTESTLDKMLTTLAVAYVRVKIPGLAPQNAAQYFEAKHLDGFKQEIKTRFADNPFILKNFEKKIDEISRDWEYTIKQEEVKNYKGNKKIVGLLKRPGGSLEEKDIWVTMQSMREIDTSSFLQIDLPKKKRR